MLSFYPIALTLLVHGAAHASMETVQAPGTPRPRQQWPNVVVETRIEPHWRVGVPVSTTRIFRCLHRSIAITTFYVGGPGRWRTNVRDILLDGTSSPGEIVASINNILDRFGATPDIYPECVQSRIRLNISDADIVRGSRSEVISIQ